MDLTLMTVNVHGERELYAHTNHMDDAMRHARNALQDTSIIRVEMTDDDNGEMVLTATFERDRVMFHAFAPL